MMQSHQFVNIPLYILFRIIEGVLIDSCKIWIKCDFFSIAGSQSSLGANAAPGTAQTAANASSGGSGAVQTDAGASQTAAGGTQIQTTSTMG